MDFNYLHQYAEDTGKELCDKFFNSAESISGQGIVQFTSVNQINFFVLRILLQEWKKESAKLESPFFDFSNEKVKEGLDAFMEVLSHHISVKRSDFEPILQGAIEESILLAIAPDRFFKSILFDPKVEVVMLDEVKEAKKYVRINKFAFTEIEDAFGGRHQVESKEFQTVLKAVFSDKSKWHNKELFLEEVNELFPLDIVQLLGKGESIGNAVDRAASINDHHQQVVRTLNDELVGHGKMESLKSAFSLNQRFGFIKHLFDGNENLFTEAIDKVDNMSSYDEAVNHLLDTYSDHFKWGEQEDLVGELFGTMNKRY